MKMLKQLKQWLFPKPPEIQRTRVKVKCSNPKCLEIFPYDRDVTAHKAWAKCYCGRWYELTF